MGWLILVIICIVVLTVLLHSYRRKKAIKTDTAPPIADGHAEDGPSTAVDQTEKPIEDLPRDTNRQPRIYKPLTTFSPSTAQQKSYVRYDWQKLFEDSIVSFFSEELSPASLYLYEANRLERAGADQILVEQALARARKQRQSYRALSCALVYREEASKANGIGIPIGQIHAY